MLNVQFIKETLAFAKSCILSGESLNEDDLRRFTEAFYQLNEAIMTMSLFQPHSPRERVKMLGEAIGYGYLMQTAREMWREHLMLSGYSPGGEFMVGPCASFTVPCECKDPAECKWCCGSSWLTKHVKFVKDEVERAQGLRA